MIFWGVSSFCRISSRMTISEKGHLTPLTSLQLSLNTTPDPPSLEISSYSPRFLFKSPPVFRNLDLNHKKNGSILPIIVGSAVSTLALSPKLSSPIKTNRLQISQSRHCSAPAPLFKLHLTSTRGSCIRCCSKNNKPEESVEKDNGLNWRILKRWDVPWNWQTISLTTLSCPLSYVFTGLIEALAFHYSGLNVEELSLDEIAGMLFVGAGIATTVVLAILYRLTKSVSSLPDDIYRYDWREPFNLKKGWLLWAGIGFGGALAAETVTTAAMSFFNGGRPLSQPDALARLLPFIGSRIRLPTLFSVFISAAVFAGAHFTPEQFPQLFVFGIAMGISYAQTRNLLTPITIHALWNSGVVLFLTFLKLRGYNIEEWSQARRFSIIWNLTVSIFCI